MLENIKPGFNAFLRPLARLLARLGLHPNHLTLAGLIFFIVASWLSAGGNWIGAFILVLAGGLMDSMDGLLARETGKKSVFGAIFDSSSDRVTEIVLLFGLTVFYMTSRVVFPYGIYLCYAAVTTSLMVSYVKARCEAAGIKCGTGVLQRPERIILFALGLLLGPLAMNWILLLIAVLASVTVIQRLHEAALGSRTREP